MIVAVIPAAGLSSRMGRPKLSLPFRGRTILEHVVDTLHQAPVEHVVVVVGPHVRELIPLATQARALVCELTEQTPDMRSTVEAGLAWIESHFAMRSDDRWLLCPADHPCLEPAVVCELCEAAERHPEASIFVPTFEGRRGHPLLLAWKHVTGFRALPAGQGLNALVRHQAEQTREVAVPTPGVLVDLDTPEDYERLN